MRRNKRPNKSECEVHEKFGTVDIAKDELDEQSDHANAEFHGQKWLVFQSQ